jgi:hypothetical protein
MLRRRFSNPFKALKQSPRHTSRAIEQDVSNERIEPAPPVSRITSRPSSQLTPEGVLDELNRIELYIRDTTARVRHLQALIDRECPTVQVTETKRELKAAHRNLEKLQLEKRGLFGDDVDGQIKEATRYAWGAYRRMVALEEKLRSSPASVSSSDCWTEDCEKEIQPVAAIYAKRASVDDTDTTAGATDDKQERRATPATYVPSGARRIRERRPTPLGLRMTDAERNSEVEVRRMSGSLPRDGMGLRDMTECTTATATTGSVEISPHEWKNDKRSDDVGRAYNGGHVSDDSLYKARRRNRKQYRKENLKNDSPIEPTEQTMEQFPQPKDKIVSRLHVEEARTSSTLGDPDRKRQGSCNGFMVADMVMSGIVDERFVLPYFHYIKHHEVRALKQWLSDKKYITKTDGISRIEKVLHCIHLLQTGCRYETLAVIFSRTPRQVEQSCHEVMEGLLNLHGFTMIKTHDQEMYTTLWGIWERFDSPENQPQAEYYYGFDWLDIGKVMVTLNLYIGRWREQGRFALSGPSDRWGRYFGAEGTGRFPRMTQGARVVYSSDESSDDGDDATSDSDNATSDSDAF